MLFWSDSLAKYCAALAAIVAVCAAPAGAEQAFIIERFAVNDAPCRVTFPDVQHPLIITMHESKDGEWALNLIVQNAYKAMHPYFVQGDIIAMDTFKRDHQRLRLGDTNVSAQRVLPMAIHLSELLKMDTFLVTISNPRQIVAFLEESAVGTLGVGKIIEYDDLGQGLAAFSTCVADDMGAVPSDN